MTIGNLILDLLNIYCLLIVVRALISWIQIDPRNQFVRILRALTDPIINPIQKMIPPIGGTLDISPIAAIFLVQLIRELLLRVL